VSEHTPLTRDDLLGCQATLDRCEVYLERFGRVAWVQELSGRLQAMASRKGVEQIHTSDGIVRAPDPVKRNFYKIAFGLRTAEGGFLLGDTEDEVLLNIGAVEGMGWRDQLLLIAVMDRLTDGALTDDEREFLRGEHSTTEMLSRLTVDQSPDQLLETSNDDDDVWAVALRMPAVLLSEVPLGIIRRLAAQVRQEQQDLASCIAAAILGGLQGGASEDGSGVSLRDVIPPV